MAKRRMFSLDIVNSDDFLDMGVGSRELYFQLGMNADDDGFITPKRVMRVVGATDDDLKVLIAKRFILPFENGVIVIKHWRANNYIQKDRYQETRHKHLKEKLYLNENGDYTDRATKTPLLNPKSIHNVYKKDTQVRLGKVRLGNISTNVDKSSLSSKVKKLIETYNEAFNRKTRPLAEYQPLLKKRLQTFSLEEICQAITNAGLEDWATGKTERGWTADVKFMLRNDANIERFLEGGISAQKSETAKMMRRHGFSEEAIKQELEK